MRVKAARFHNFRLLRDVRLEFSLDQQRPLTVIRGQNASGKTSLLTGLTWALYGTQGVTSTSQRLSPSDWADGEVCRVSAQLDFQQVAYNQIAGRVVESVVDYRVIREVTELPEGDHFTREPDVLTLYRLTDEGDKPVSNPELELEDMLPPAMKDIFFTDGDSALSFISSQLSAVARRDQVKDAIKALLGLDLLEDASKHVDAVRTKLRQQVSAAAGDNRLDDVQQILQKRETSQQRDEEARRDVQAQIEVLGRQLQDAEAALQTALQNGRYEDVAADLASAKKQLATGRGLEKQFKADHQTLFEAEDLSLGLLREPLHAALEGLHKLHDAGVIPKTAVPVFQDRLELGICICGATLADGSDARAHLEALIAEQRTSDEEQKTLTRLFHQGRTEVEAVDDPGAAWVGEMLGLEFNRLSALQLIEDAGGQIKLSERRLAEISQSEVVVKRGARDSLRAALTEKESRRQQLDGAIAGRSELLSKERDEFKRLMDADRKLNVFGGRLDAAEEVHRVLSNSMGSLQRDYLVQVSERMNELFMQMVGFDPALAQILRGASITENYEIMVLTADDRLVKPGEFLNGASQRALTLAFIWALTEVSGVLAPRFIDTPLGMMDDTVKKRVLRLLTSPQGEVSKGEKQVIMFLTRSEIKDVEDVLDERAGIVATITNTEHYPGDLKNDPRRKRPEILVCSCDHRQVCSICERRLDAGAGLVLRGA